MCKLNFIFLGICLLLVGVNCNNTVPIKYQEFVGEAQGTTFYITYFDSNQTDYSEEMKALLEEFDQQVSTYKPGSVINQFNNNEIDTIFKFKHPFLFQSFYDSWKLKTQSNYYFDVGIFPVIQFLNSIDTLPKTGDKVFDSIHGSIDRSYLITEEYTVKKDPRSQFNFNAIAQGYSVDVLSDFLESKGVNHYMVEIGGELRVKGKNKEGKLWTVSLEAPNSTRENRVVQALVELNNQAVVTSGSYRKFKEIDGKKYSHAINPKTGLGVTHNLLSVSVITEKAYVADALATAFLVMGKDKTTQFLDSANVHNVSLLFIEADSNDTYSSSYYGDFEEYLVK